MYGTKLLLQQYDNGEHLTVVQEGPLWNRSKYAAIYSTAGDLHDASVEAAALKNGYQADVNSDEIQGPPGQGFSSHKRSLSIANVEDNDLGSFNKQADMQA